jgi:5'-nucleotidase
VTSAFNVSAPGVDELRRAIRDIPDFPKPGILFKDITPLLANGRLFRHACESMAAPFANRVLATVAGDLVKAPNLAGESSMGDVIADAQLAASAPADRGGAVIAFMNPGGVRTDILAATISGGSLYWADNQQGRMYRRDLTTGAVTLIADELCPTSLAVDGTHVYFTTCDGRVLRVPR